MAQTINLPPGATLTSAPAAGATASITFPASPGVSWVLTDIEALLVAPGIPPGAPTSTLEIATNAGGDVGVAATLPITAGRSWVVTDVNAMAINQSAGALASAVEMDGLILGELVCAVGNAVTQKDTFSWSGIYVGGVGAAIPLTLTGGSLLPSQLFLTVNAFLTANPTSTTNKVTNSIGGATGELFIGFGSAGGKDSWTWNGQLVGAIGAAVTVQFSANDGANLQVLNVKAFPCHP